MKSSDSNYRLGSRNVSLNEIFGQLTVDSIRSRFANTDSNLINVSLRELSRYMFLSSYSPRGVFFPGDKLMDDIWHALITETKNYRSLCSRIKPGNFVDHTGIKFSDYVTLRGLEETRSEQVSWLTSYHSNFGVIDKDAFDCLPLAQNIANQLKATREELNLFAQNLLAVADISLGVRDVEELEDYCSIFIEKHAREINESPEILAKTLRRLILILRTAKKLPLINNTDLELLFSASPALAFTFWQHLSAVERLAGLEAWQKNNPTVWQSLSEGYELCGLATTHLGGSKSALHGTAVDGSFAITGRAPWVTGHGFFDRVILGFETEDEIIFSLISYPGRTDSAVDFKILPLELCTFQGSSTVAIDFKNFRIAESSIISRRSKSAKGITPRMSSFKIPELGIAKRALREATALAKTKADLDLEKGISLMSQRIVRLEEERSKVNTQVDLVVEMAEIVRGSIRLLAVGVKGYALVSGSLVSQLQLDALLLDAVFQSAQTIKLKLETISRA